MSGTELDLQLRLRTSEIDRQPGGLPLRADYEEFLVSLSAAFPLVPPVVRVGHRRFVGHPHVLQGDRLCIFLNLDQEWHPNLGVVGFLDRLWSWLDDAGCDRFDPRTALYHPVGGVLHATAGTPTIVVRQPLSLGPWSAARRWLRRRSECRLDLVSSSGSSDALAVSVLKLQAPLRYGAGNSLVDLCIAMRHAGQPVNDFLYLLSMAAARNAAHQPSYFLLAAPVSEGAEEQDSYLICGRLGVEVTASLRAAAKEHGALLQVNASAVSSDSVIEWCAVSEERVEKTVRRDHRRPVSEFAGKHVVLWGCGGLGSWVGEFLARAGVGRLTLSDPGTVTGPLLVRQDFTEQDVGMGKAEALANRLRAISDTLKVDVTTGSFEILTERRLPECDILIDATISNTVASILGIVWSGSVHQPLVARISTDGASSTLGLITITCPPDGPDPERVDQLAAQAVADDATLEAFMCFWEAPEPSDELNPAPGCSVPTFHGSAADLAALAGSMMSLLGPHLKSRGLTGSHFIALPHSHVQIAHRWISA